MSQQHTHLCGATIGDVPSELLIEIMKKMPDFLTLTNFLVAFPSAGSLFRYCYNDIVQEIIESGIKGPRMPRELQNLIRTVVVVRYGEPLTDSVVGEGPYSFGDLNTLLCRHLYNQDASYHLDLSAYPLYALQSMVQISADIELQIQSFVAARIQVPSACNGVANTPASFSELHRIRRAFWRLQLGCDLSHHRYFDNFVNDNTQFSYSDNGDEKRRYFLSRLCIWEHDELESIRFHLQSEPENALPFGDEDLAIKEVLQQIDTIGQENPISREPESQAALEAYNHLVHDDIRCTRYAESVVTKWSDSTGTNVVNTSRRAFMQLGRRDLDASNNGVGACGTKKGSKIVVLYRRSYMVNITTSR